MNVRRLLITLALTAGLYVSTSQAAPPTRPLLRPGNPVVAPVSNAHTASPTTTLSITYDEPIDPATVSPQTFAVHARQTGLLTRTYGVYNGTISLTPTQSLKPGELVQASATVGTLSLLDGTGPAAPTVWEFRTGVSGGNGRFDDSGQRLGGAYGVEVELGDLDGDGDLDAFVVNGDGQNNRVWLNDGTGSFFDSGQGLWGPWNHGVALGDLDGDGDLDAFVVNTRNNPNRVWLNAGGAQGGTPGIFYDSGQRLGSSRSNGVALGDLDGDGDLDAFVSNYNFYDGQPNRVWLNDGTGTFHSNGQSLGNSSSYSVALGDVDGDGDLDAFVANSHYYANRVWLNDGTGMFTDSGQGLGSSISWSVALGDVDGDGDLDAFVANSYGQSNRVWRNNGAGVFYNSQSLGNSYSNGVELGDLDGDGDLDAFVANWNNQANRVWLNNGTGAFYSGQSLGGSRSHNVALGDVDGDGDLDAFVTNGPSQADRVWLNRSRTDLSLTKTVTPAIVAAGQTITYTLAYTNHGPQAATDVAIVDVIPGALTNVSYTYSGATITSSGSISYAWQVDDLKPGQGGVITITAEVDSSVSGVLSLSNEASIATAVVEESLHDNTSVVDHTVDAAPPLMPALISPANSTVISNSLPALTWEASSSSDVEGYLLDWNGMVIGVGASTQYTPGILADSVYTWTVAAYDKVGNTSPYADVWTFTVEAASPQIKAVTPFSAATDVTITAPVVITFSEPISVSTFTYTVTPDPGGWQESWNSAATVATLTHSVFDDSTVYGVTVTAANDLAGRSLLDAPYAWSFLTVDSMPPRVLSVSPISGATGVSITAPLLITFSEPIHSSTFTYTVTPDPGGWKESWNSAANVATLTHTAFDGSTFYTITINAANDLAGHSLLGAPYVWSFITADSVPPQVLSVSPIMGATGVSITAPLLITFSEPIHSSTFTYAVTPDPGNWKDDWNSVATVVTLTHSVFNNGTVYAVTVTAANDLAGHQLSDAPVEWSFTTSTAPVPAPPPDKVSPQVLTTEPINEATGVDSAAPVVITFSEAISVNTFIYSIVPDPGGWVENWNNTATVVTLTHNLFADWTTCSATITVAEDLVGNLLLDAPYVWHFTTTPRRVYLPLIMR